MLIILGLMIAGCGRDPILERADDLATAPSATDPGLPQPVQADSPDPVAPDAPSPAIPDEPDPASGLRIEGPSIVLKGVVAVANWQGGPVRVDVFDGDQKAAAGHSDKRPSVVAVAHLDAPGGFEVRVPMSTGLVWVGAFVDEDRDGRPGPGDPSGWYTGNPVSTDADRSSLDVSLAAGQQ